MEMNSVIWQQWIFELKRIERKYSRISLRFAVLLILMNQLFFSLIKVSLISSYLLYMCACVWLCFYAWVVWWHVRLKLHIGGNSIIRNVTQNRGKYKSLPFFTSCINSAWHHHNKEVSYSMRKWFYYYLWWYWCKDRW